MEHNRDLMYVARASAGHVSEEREIECLHRILSTVETTAQLCTCTEIIDLTLFSVITLPGQVREILRSHHLKPFQFVSNKN